MEIYILILCELICFILAYCLFDQDLFSPVVVSLLVVFCATLFVLPSIDIWNVSIQWSTIFVILIGEIVLIIGGIVSKSFYWCMKSNVKKKKITYSIYPIHYRKPVEFVLCFLSLFFTILYMLDAIKVGMSYGGSGFSAIAYMKDAYLNNLSGMRMNVIIRQSFKLVMAISYIAAFSIATNVIALGEKIKRNCKYCMMFMCGCAITIFSGSRTEILRLCSALVLYSVVAIRITKGWRLRAYPQSAFLVIKKFAPLLCVTVLLAFFSRTIVKVKGTRTSEIVSVFKYLSYYIGSSIQVLNIKLSYYKSFAELLLGTDSVIPEFVILGELDYGGNVATIFQSLLIYNGALGMCVYLFVYSFVGTFLYFEVSKVGYSFLSIFKIIIFGYCYFVFTMAFYTVCTTVLFQKSNIAILLIVVLLFRLLICFQLKKKKVK